MSEIQKGSSLFFLFPNESFLCKYTKDITWNKTCAFVLPRYFNFELQLTNSWTNKQFVNWGKQGVILYFAQIPNNGKVYWRILSPVTYKKRRVLKRNATLPPSNCLSGFARWHYGEKAKFFPWIVTSIQQADKP